MRRKWLLVLLVAGLVPTARADEQAALKKEIAALREKLEIVAKEALAAREDAEQRAALARKVREGEADPLLGKTAARKDADLARQEWETGIKKLQVELDLLRQRQEETIKRLQELEKMKKNQE